MKKITFILLALITTGTAFGQVTGTADVNAVLVQPLEISGSRDLNFGSIAQNTAGGRVRIAHDVAGTRTFNNSEMKVPTSTVAPSSAIFNIVAPTGYTYGISIPNIDITHSDGTTIPLAFTHSMASSGNSGSADLYVGGVIDIVGSESIGAYTGTVSVTVTYE